MFRKIIIAFLLFTLVLNLPLFALGQETKEITAFMNMAETEKEQLTLQLREALRISAQAKAKKQETVLSFQDVQSHWAGSEIATAYGLNLVKGYPDGSFKPDGIMSGREGFSFSPTSRRYLS